MIFFLIPIFNEEGNIQNLYNELAAVLPNENKFFVFSDDGSIDKSKELIQLYFKNDKHVLLGDGNNYGPGIAFNTGFEWILSNSKSDTDIVITMEADCTSDLRILPQMIGVNKLGFPTVLASVYSQGGGFDSTSFFRKLISSIANLFFRFVFDLKILTLSSFYRCYSISLLKKIHDKYDKQIIKEPGFICMLELLLKGIAIDSRVVEIPMVLQSQKRVGKSKMKTLKTTISYFLFMIKFKK